MTRFILGVLAVYLIAAESKCAQKGTKTKTAEAAVSYRIAGVVQDAETGAPVAGAELSISESNIEMKVKADEAGRFAFEGMEPGKYPVQASAPGYVRESYNQHRYFSTSMVVGSGLDSEHMVFRLHRQAVITGAVTDERGEAVRHAQVMLFKEDQSGGKRMVQMAAQAQTDDLGAYRFAHLTAGKYYVAVAAQPWYAQTGLGNESELTLDQGVASSGAQLRTKAAPTDSKLDVVYPTTFYPGVTDESSAGDLEVSAGETAQADVRLQAVPAVHVRLTNAPSGGKENTQPGFGAMQRLFGTTTTALRTVSGQVAPGVFEIGGLPPGDVTLTLAENLGGGWENRAIHVNLNQGAKESVDARAAGDGVTVKGRVIAAEGSGAAVEGNVVLTGKQGESISRNLQKDGSFSFAGVQPDTYGVSANLGSDGDTDYVEQLTAKGAKASGEEVTIEEGGDVQLVIRVSRGFGTLKGVVNLEGKPAAGIMVLLVPASGGNLQSAARLDQSDSDGSFTLARIVPGKYLLLAIEDGWDLDWMAEGALDPYREKGQLVEIRANEMKNLKLEAEKRKPVARGE